MSMNSGGTGRIASEINVTPLIDVLLVLLIIFMVIVPVIPRGLNSLIPQPDKSAQRTTPEETDTIIVQVLANGAGEPAYRINQTDFAKAQIEPELTRIFAARQNKVMFVKGDAALEFSKVAEVIDMGHQADVDNIGLITPRIAAGQ
jgi:biopolymer transport protein TolR